MNSTRFFFEAATELMTCLAQLSRMTESCLREAEDVLCRKHEYPPGTDLLAAIGHYNLVIAKNIEDVMSAFDMLCTASGGKQRFAFALDALDAPDVVQSKLEHFLDRFWQEQQRPA